MMIECPKCGFIQPKDKFCAKCGVDVELFEPQRPPLYKQLLKSTTVQIFVLIGLVAMMVSTIYFRHSQKQESLLQLSENMEITQTVGPSPSPKSKPVSTSVSKSAKKTSKSPLSKELSKDVKVTTSVPKKQITFSSPKKRGEKGHQKIPPPEGPRAMTKIYVRFAEAPQSTLNDVVFKNGLLGSDEYLRAGSYKLGQRLSQMPKKITGLSFLPGTRSKRLPISNDDPMIFQFLHMGEGAQEYGLQLRIYPHLNSGQLTVDLEGEMNLKSVSGENMINSSLQSSYTLPQNEVLIVELAIPAQPMDEAHMSSLSGTPLSIMSRTDFLDGLTSLVILIQTR